ncbi:MAG: hypothetical protein WCF85_20370, partial [Rhodospirillaceae bacterium]
MSNVLVVADSIDVFGVTADLAHGYWTLSSASLNATAGRFGRKGIVSGIWYGTATRNLPSAINIGPVIAGAAFNYLGGGGVANIIALLDGSGNT